MYHVTMSIYEEYDDDEFDQEDFDFDDFYCEEEEEEQNVYEQILDIQNCYQGHRTLFELVEFFCRNKKTKYHELDYFYNRNNDLVITVKNHGILFCGQHATKIIEISSFMPIEKYILKNSLT